MFTEQGLKEQEALNEKRFSFLKIKYDPFVGNFQLAKSEVIEWFDTIEEWIELFPYYTLVYQPMEEYESADWFLTSFVE